MGKATLGMDEVQAGEPQSRTAGSAGGTQGPSEQITTLCALCLLNGGVTFPIRSFTQAPISQEAGRYSKIKTGFRFGNWALAAVSALICHLTLSKACHHSEPAK